jgi:AcrR family transcriptional regulator
MPAAQPQQSRSRETYERVVTAAEQLFAEAGEPGFTIPAVSRLAGVSIGTVYKRFATKEALLLAVLARLRTEETLQIYAGWDTVDWRELDSRSMLLRLIGDIATTWRNHAPLMRALMARRLRTDRDYSFDQGVDALAAHGARFERVVLTHAREITQADQRRAIDFAFRLVIAGCGRWTAETIETVTSEPMSWDAMVENLADVLDAYLFGKSEAPRRRSDLR